MSDVTNKNSTKTESIENISTGDLANIRRLREALSTSLSDLKHLTGSAFVVCRNNGSVLCGETSTFVWSLKTAMEVSPDADPQLYGGDYITSRTGAHRAIAEKLERGMQRMDRIIQDATSSIAA